MTGKSLTSHHLLLLAGAGEARDIAQRLAERGALRVTASLLQASRGSAPFAVPTRVGRFSGHADLKQFIIQQDITAVLDATHPFAAEISQHAADVSRALRIPHAQVLRPAWVPMPGDRWQIVPDETAVAAALSPGNRVFTTTGRATLEGMRIAQQVQFFVRQLEARPPPAHQNVHYIIGKGPFSVADEVKILQELKIDVLVTKNNGGLPSRTKLDAARELGIKVILIARPPLLDVTHLDSVAAAMNWINALGARP